VRTDIDTIIARADQVPEKIDILVIHPQPAGFVQALKSGSQQPEIPLFTEGP
jgi:hypothetical protein